MEDTGLSNITVDMMEGKMITVGSVRHKGITGMILVDGKTLTIPLLVTTLKDIIRKVE